MRVSIVLFAILFSLGKAAPPVCTLKDPAPTDSTCGAVGVITDFDYLIEDLYDSQYASIHSCANECAKRAGCKSFNIRSEDEETPYCELQAGTQNQARFVPENDANRTATSYQGFDLACFDCINSASGDGLQSSSSSVDSSSTIVLSSAGSSTGSSSLSMTGSASGYQSSSVQGSPSATSTQSTICTTESLSSSIGSASVSRSSIFQDPSTSGTASIVHSTTTTSSAILTISSLTTPATPTTTPYVCHEDNCYRALLRFGHEAKSFCSGYTATDAQNASVPAYLDNCSRKPEMISSGCSCLATWISPDPEPTLSAPISASAVSGSQSTGSPLSTSTMPSSSSVASSSSISLNNTTSHNHKQMGKYANSTSVALPTTALHANGTVLHSVTASISDPTASGSSSSSTSSNVSSPVPTTETKSVTAYIVSTVYTTSVHTFTECPLTVKVCHIGLVTTTQIPVTTTLVPVINIFLPIPTINYIPPGYAMEPIYKIHVEIVDMCPPVIIDCPFRETVTKTIHAGSAICPCPTADIRVQREGTQKYCYQARLPVRNGKVMALPIHDSQGAAKHFAMPKIEAQQGHHVPAQPHEVAPAPFFATPQSLVTITTKDASGSHTIVAPINKLPPPPCGLKLAAFMYPEEAYQAHCPDYASTTTEAMPVSTSSAPLITVTMTNNGVVRTITDTVDKLPPPPCGLKLSAFKYPEEAYQAHCPDYVSSTTEDSKPTPSVSMVTVTVTEHQTTRTVTTTWNSAFMYQEEALWTHPPGNGETWSLPPPSTQTPSGLKMPDVPEFWKEPAFTSSVEAKPMVTTLPLTVQSVPMKEDTKKSAAGRNVAGKLGAMLAVVAGMGFGL